MMDSADYPSEAELAATLEETRDRAAKLRQAAKDAARVAGLEMADE
tara:strand:+ start:2374 stop:2511 length:138 start_codon:yes stop_codon:yes gene_type:complete